MSICTNESTTKIAKLNSRELKMCKNLGQIRENIGVYSTYRCSYWVLLQCKTIAGGFNGAFWWYGPLSEDQENFNKSTKTILWL